MRRLFLVVFFLIAIATLVRAEDEFAIITAPSGGNLRAAPNTKSEKLGLIPYLSPVKKLLTPFEVTTENITVEGITGTWQKIEWGGKVGYVFSGLLCSDPEEIALINTFGGKVERSMNRLTIKADNGVKAIFEDVPTCDDKSIIHRLSSFLPAQKLILINCNLWEGHGSYIVNVIDGRKLSLDAPPIFSPDLKWFATVNGDLEAQYTENRVQIFDFSNGIGEVKWSFSPTTWAPRSGSWESPELLRVSIAVASNNGLIESDIPYYVKLDTSSGKWELHEKNPAAAPAIQVSTSSGESAAQVEKVNIVTSKPTATEAEKVEPEIIVNTPKREEQFSTSTEAPSGREKETMFQTLLSSAGLASFIGFAVLAGLVQFWRQLYFLPGLLVILPLRLAALGLAFLLVLLLIKDLDNFDFGSGNQKIFLPGLFVVAAVLFFVCMQRAEMRLIAFSRKLGVTLGFLCHAPIVLFGYDLIGTGYWFIPVFSLFLMWATVPVSRFLPILFIDLAFAFAPLFFFFNAAGSSQSNQGQDGNQPITMGEYLPPEPSQIPTGYSSQQNAGFGNFQDFPNSMGSNPEPLNLDPVSSNQPTPFNNQDNSFFIPGQAGSEHGNIQFTDSTGMPVSTIYSDGTVRDSSGIQQGNVETSSGQAFFRGQDGLLDVSVSESGQIRSAEGFLIGSLNNSTGELRDSNGSLLGRISNDTGEIRDAKGILVGRIRKS